MSDIIPSPLVLSREKENNKTYNDSICSSYKNSEDESRDNLVGKIRREIKRGKIFKLKGKRRFSEGDNWNECNDLYKDKNVFQNINEYLKHRKIFVEDGENARDGIFVLKCKNNINEFNYWDINEDSDKINSNDEYSFEILKTLEKNVTNNEHLSMQDAFFNRL